MTVSHFRALADEVGGVLQHYPEITLNSTTVSQIGTLVGVGGEFLQNYPEIILKLS